ncbi:MAG: MmcQ/YjbR family DNA-binding protein [Planctomycetes bacterium]|nr:MmcQ/YjbR family DNA-binding protein [Planctomycetota bacterium]
MASSDSPHHPCLVQLRRQLARLPEAVEIETWGHPTFRAGKKIYAIFGDENGGPALNVKQQPEQQEALLERPGYFYPPYTGHKGWIGVLVDEVPWEDIEPILVDGYRQVALKRMLKALDG